MAKRPKRSRPVSKSSPLPPQTPKATPKGGAARPPAQPPAQPQFVTIAQAAARLGVSEKTIRRWIVAGRLAAVRMGSQIRIPLGALLHFIGSLPPAQPQSVVP